MSSDIEIHVYSTSLFSLVVASEKTVLIIVPVIKTSGGETGSCITV